MPVDADLFLPESGLPDRLKVVRCVKNSDLYAPHARFSPLPVTSRNLSAGTRSVITCPMPIIIYHETTSVPSGGNLSESPFLSRCLLISSRVLVWSCLRKMVSRIEPLVSGAGQALKSRVRRLVRQKAISNGNATAMVRSFMGFPLSTYSFLQLGPDLRAANKVYFKF